MPSSAQRLRNAFSAFLDTPGKGQDLRDVLRALGLGALRHHPGGPLKVSLELAQIASVLFVQDQKWQQRALAISEALALLETLETEGCWIPRLVYTRNSAGNPYGGHMGQFPIAASLVQDFDRKILVGIRCFQALLVRAILENPESENQQLVEFADLIRSASIRARPIHQLLSEITQQLGITDTAVLDEGFWLRLRDLLPDLRSRFSSRRNALRFLYIVDQLTKNFSSTRLPCLVASPVLPKKPSRFSALNPGIAKRERKTTAEPPEKISSDTLRATRIWAVPDPDSDPRSPDHEEQLIARTTSVAADVPDHSLERVRLEVRYSNYNTALDNQYLPHVWETLSRVEIACLTHHLCVDLRNDETPEAAFWSALLLLTGQTMEFLHQLVTNSHSEDDRLDSDGQWHRYIRLPEQAFSPSVEQQNDLVATSTAFALQLPTCLGRHVRGAIQKLTESGGGASAIEDFVRAYCNRLRTSTGFRFSPGRIAAVLKPRIMECCADPVLVYLMAGRKTDVPPMGIFYASFPKATLRHIYQQATVSLLGEP